MARLISYLRMSTSEQLKGISLERQRNLIADFASKNDFQEVIQFEDIGRSSFAEDENQKELNKFFVELEENKFEKGDVFALENIDRLTRRGAIDALLKVNKIIQKGLKIAIISDKEQRILEEIDIYSIITLSIDASRANKESEVKSQKGLINWEHKRKLAATEKVAMTKRAPSWIDTEIYTVFDEEKKKEIKRRRYVLNEEKAQVVRLIFDLTLKGYGCLKIKTYLNENNIKPFNKNVEYWEPSVIPKILKNPATFGLYQPQKQRSGKRDLVAAGDPIEDYFPPVISKEIFEQCRLIAENNFSERKGRKGEKFTNVFTGLLKCEKCGGPVHLLNCGIDKRNVSQHALIYLICKKAKFTKQCSTRRMRYDAFEASIFKAVNEINLVEVLNENNPLNELIKKQRSIETAINKKKKLLENYEKSFIENDGEVPAFMISAAKTAEIEIKELEEEKKEILNEISSLNYYNNNLENSIEEIKNNSSYEKRAKINLLFHEIIKSISIDLVEKYSVITFKNDITRIIDKDGFVINVDRVNKLEIVEKDTTTISAEIANNPKMLLEYFEKMRRDLSED
ncbi:TPA: recombinase family protein [Pseudomonas aeruginosa]|nr:recombinase family protein [Pseudomonas aeruginosa]